MLCKMKNDDPRFAGIHYLPDGTVAGTVILLKGSGLGTDQVPDLLAELDQEWLPGVDLGSGHLNFTVIFGEVLGNYEPNAAS